MFSFLRKPVLKWLTKGTGKIVLKEVQVIETHYHHHYSSDKKPIAREDGANTAPVKELQKFL